MEGTKKEDSVDFVKVVVYPPLSGFVVVDKMNPPSPAASRTYTRPQRKTPSPLDGQSLVGNFIGNTTTTPQSPVTLQPHPAPVRQCSEGLVVSVRCRMLVGPKSEANRGVLVRLTPSTSGRYITQ